MIAQKVNNKFVILDDNFSHKSMRKPYYRLARETGSSYIEIKLSIDVEEAILRNSKRIKPVPEDVIRNMKIEDSAYPEHTLTLIDGSD
jgi:tRNA uridine 5-carbamoylmethylation protein Kti12